MGPSALVAGDAAAIYIGICASLIRLRRLNPTTDALRIPCGRTVATAGLAVCVPSAPSDLRANTKSRCPWLTIMRLRAASNRDRPSGKPPRSYYRRGHRSFEARANRDMHQPGQRLAGARYPGDRSVAPYGTFAIIRFASSTEKPRSVSLRTLPSEPAFRSAVVTASSGPSKIITMS